MPETVLSAIIVAAAGILIAGLFLGIRVNKRKRMAAIEQYCQEKGYACSVRTGGLEQALEITGSGFVLSGTKKSLRHDGQTGSDSWQREVVWCSSARRGGRLDFTLGAVQSSLAWEKLPEGMRALMLQKLGMAAQGARLDGAPAPIAVRGGTLLLFDGREMPGRILDGITRELSGWPSVDGLVITSSGDGLLIRRTNAGLDSVEDIGRYVRLGQACAGQDPPPDA